MERGWVFCVLGVMAFLAAGCTTTGDGPSSDAGVGRQSTGSTELPCDVEAALDSVCRDCHQKVPKFGAPMALTTWEDTQAPAVSDSTKTVYERMGERINSTTDPMPPAPFHLSAADKGVLDAWIDAGAPARAAGATCGASDGGTNDGGGDGGFVDPGVGPDALPCDPQYEFLAHDGTDPTQGYAVPTGGTGNYYICFAFKAPWGAGEQGTAWAPVIDDDRVLHHWILWETKQPQTDGGVAPCGALPANDAKFLAGWAPGGKNYVMPDDVGLKLDPDSYLLLQIHYWNTSGVTDVHDKSGVAICTDTGRPNEAGVIAVGPTSLDLKAREVTTESVTCPGDITKVTGGFNILASFPHMHNLGKSFETDILRSGGGVETLTTVDPWNFNNQTFYPKRPPVYVNPGDAIRVSCTYDNYTNQDVSWGEKTEDEMCFDFLMVYPVPDIQSLLATCGIDFPVSTLVCNEQVAQYAPLICGYCPEVCQ